MCSFSSSGDKNLTTEKKKREITTEATEITEREFIRGQRIAKERRKG